MKSLDEDWHNNLVEHAYIISLVDNPVSQSMTQRCIHSLEQVGQPYKIWPAFDGTQGRPSVPDHLQNQSHLLWPKLVTSILTWKQVACFLSHFSLWCHCLTIDKPIVILEHDAVMIQPYLKHRLYNSIVYLGGIEQMQGRPVFATPPHATAHDGRLKSLCRAHAYAIDPAVARSLVGYTIHHGITDSLDMYVRADLFPISQFDVYAYDLSGESTIAEPDETIQGTRDMTTVLKNLHNQFQHSDYDDDIVGITLSLFNLAVYCKTQSDLHNITLEEPQDPDNFHKIQPHFPAMKYRKTCRHAMAAALDAPNEELLCQNLFTTVWAVAYIYHLPVAKMYNILEVGTIMDRPGITQLLLDDTMSPNLLKEPTDRDFTALYL